MFNFIFDSSIGNMLAPVKSAVCQFHMAIQHNRIDEINTVVQSGSVELGNVQDAGYADVHVACRYNNRYALELLINRGVSKDLQDKNGNTCVHYCSKYGHLDLCRWLIGLGCSPASKNQNGESPYDVAENHLIRQYLLPLQFQAERDRDGAQGAPMTHSTSVPIESSPLYEAANSLMAPRPAYPGYISQAPSGPSGGAIPPPVVLTSNGYASTAPVLMPNAPGAASSPVLPPSGRVPIVGGITVNKVQAIGIPTNTSSSSLDDPSPKVNVPLALDSGGNTPPGDVYPPTVTFLSPQQYAAPAATFPLPVHGMVQSWVPATTAYKPQSAAKRVITPDGFGSSASDPNLQKKYGNVKEIQTTAPPPTFLAPTGGPSVVADAPPFPGGNYAARNPFSMPNPYALPTPNVLPPPRSMGATSNHSSSNSLSGLPPDVFNPKTDVNISVEASSSSSAIL